MPRGCWPAAKHKGTQHRCRADVIAIENADGLTGCVQAGNQDPTGIYDFGLRGYFQPAESKGVGRDDRKATERRFDDWPRPIGFCGQQYVGALAVELACVPGARRTRAIESVIVASSVSGDIPILVASSRNDVASIAGSSERTMICQLGVCSICWSKMKYAIPPGCRDSARKGSSR